MKRGNCAIPSPASARFFAAIVLLTAQRGDAVTNFLETIGYNVVDAGSLADSWRIEPNTPIYFWRYAPVVPEGVSGDEAKRIYQQRGEPVSPTAARKLIDDAVRPSPIGGTLEGMPQVHVDLFLEQASADTVKK